MKVEFITKEDLEIFKQEIITEIRRYSPFNRKKDQELNHYGLKVHRFGLQTESLPRLY